MSRYRLFIENFFIYGLGNVLGKCVPLLLLPVLVRLIPDASYFGVIDLFIVLVSLGTPFALLGTYDAMFRFFFEESSLEYKNKVCSSTLSIVLVSSIVFAVLIFLFSKPLTKLFFKDGQYIFVTLLAGLTVALSAQKSIFSAPTRMQNQRIIFIMMSILTPILYYSIAIIVIKMGKPLEGMLAGRISSIVITYIIFLLLNHKWFHISFIDLKLVKEIFLFGLPLAPTFLIYWIFTSCDRIMLAQIVGTASVGIYGVGARVAQISQLLYTAFAHGWQYFAFSTMKDRDHIELMSRVYELLGLASFISLILLTPWIKWIFPILFPGEYATAYIIFPYLFISPLLLMLSQIAGTQLQIIKKPALSTISRFSGAFANILLNLILIPLMGFEGAAIATFTGYVISVVVITSIVIHKNLLQLHLRFFLASVLSLLFILVVRLFLWDYLIFSVMFSIVLALFLALLYRIEIIILFRKVTLYFNK